MTTPSTPQQQTGEHTSTEDGAPCAPSRVVVGLDHRGRSTSALVWAVEEVERAGATLTLLSAHPEGTTSAPGSGHDLDALAARLTLAEVTRRDVAGAPVTSLLDAASEADVIVVGCRSMAPAQRMILGGTSLAVARWSPVPVVVVPEAWIQPSMADAPIVAGVRPMQVEGQRGSVERDHEVLDFCFARAAALGVPIAVVSAWEIPTVLAWSPDDIQQMRSEHDRALTRRLAAWRETYPQVEVTVHSVAEGPDQALLDASKVAQMVVVGRHHSATLSGLIGTTTRRVLRHASRPVAVIPTGSRDELLRDLEVHRSLSSRPWAPVL